MIPGTAPGMGAPDPGGARLRDMALVVIVGSLVLVPFLGETHRLYSREVRHAQIAREMAASGDLLVPTLFGEEYHDKPPVMHAAIAILYRLAGEHSMALARLPSAVAALLGALALYGIGLVLGGRRAALLASLGLFGVVGYWHMARVARPDMIFTMGVLGSCLGLARGMRVDTVRRGPWLALAGVGSGIATLCKGPLGLTFPLLFAALAPLRRADIRWPGARDWMVCAVFVLATASSWVVPVCLRDGGAYLERMLSQPDLTLTVDTGSQSPFWYLWNLPVHFLPLTLLLPLVVLDLRRRGYTAAAAVSLAMLILLSCIPKKRFQYLLPVYPFLTLAVAEAVVQLSDRRWMLRTAQALIVVSIVAAPTYHGTVQPWLEPGEDSQLAFARRALSRAGPDAKILCYGTMGETMAFLAPPRTVVVWNELEALSRELGDARGEVFVAFPEKIREGFASTVSRRWKIAEAVSGEMFVGKKSRRWLMFRVTPKGISEADG